MAAGPLLSPAHGSERERRLLGPALWFLFAAAVFYGVFFLPFSFPSQRISASQSYAAGFANSVSVLVTLAASLTVLLISWVSRKPIRSGLLQGPFDKPSIPVRLFVALALVYTIVLGSIAALVCWSPHHYIVDAPYLIDSIQQITLQGRHPYTDFEYDYGPILIYIPSLIYRLTSPFGVSLEVSYYFFTIATMIVGLYLLYWAIQQLSRLRVENTILFCGLAITGINLTLGANGSFLRALFPFCALLYLPRVGRKAAAVGLYLTAAELFGLSISPETGAAFGAGAGVYFLYRAITEKSLANLFPIIGLASGVLLAFVWFGPAYFDSVLRFSSGTLDWVVLPYPLLLVYLAAVIVIAPRAVAAAIRNQHPDRALYLGYFCACLMLVPAALNRCDAGHIVVNGTGVLLLAYAHLGSQSPKIRLSFVALTCLLLFAFLLRWIGLWRYGVETAIVDIVRASGPQSSAAHVVERSERVFPFLRREFESRPLPEVHPVTQLPAAVGTEPVATPWQLDKVTDRMLRETGHYAPEYFIRFTDVATETDEQRKIADLSRARWALTPHKLAIGVGDLPFVRRFFLFPANYRLRNTPYSPGEATARYLHHNYELYETLGDYELYKRK